LVLYNRLHSAISLPRCTAQRTPYKQGTSAMMGDNTFVLQSYDKSMSPPKHEERKL